MKPTVRIILIALAVINLVFLCFFADRIFTHPQAAPATPAHTEGETDIPPSLILTVPEEPLTYDGTGALPLLKGVCAQGADGTDLTERITVSVGRPTDGADPQTTRVLLYQVRGEEGSVADAERRLLLIGYRSPSIDFTGAGTSLSADDVADAARILVESGLLTADDGFGHDISASATVAPDSPITASGNYTFTVTAENMLGDVATLHTSLYVDAGSHFVTLRLTETSVTLAPGTVFDARSYLAEASDPEDGDLRDYVQTEGDVDTNHPGTYLVTYSVENFKGISAVPVTLTVTVTD